jgi:polyhydroxyalkanoate synthesis regulator phasin
MNRGDYPTFIDWWLANEDEYRALTNAEDGDPKALSDLMIQRGFLATKEAREFVAAHIRGEKKRRGAKRMARQQAKEVGILGMVREIQRELNCGEHTAREVFLDRHPDICDNQDTLKTYLRRAKETLEQAFGRRVRPVVQKSGNPEPE